MQDLGRMGLSEEQGDLFDMASDFCRERSPISAVRALLQDELGHDPAIWTEIGELGWLGVAIPEDHGGIGLGLAEAATLVECMGRHMLQTPYVSTTLAAQALLQAGTAAQQASWLPKLAAGTTATVALVDGDGRWDLQAPVCTATATSDGLALSGTKRFVSDARAAELILVSVLKDGAPILVMLAGETLAKAGRRRETIIDETKRAYELTLDGIIVSTADALDTSTAPRALDHLHLAANLLSAAEMVGANKAVIDYTVDYLNTRKQFGKLIGSYQALKHPIADAFAMYEQARSHMYAAAHNFHQQGTGEIATRMAKVSGLQSLSYASDRAIQFHGGFGFTYECDAQLYRRRAIWHGSQFGDAGYHKRKLGELLLTA